MTLTRAIAAVPDDIAPAFASGGALVRLLPRQWRAVGGALQVLGLESGSRILIAAGDGADMAAGFLGSVEAGMVPVLVRNPAQSPSAKAHLLRVARDCSATAVLASGVLTPTVGAAVDGPVLDIRDAMDSSVAVQPTDPASEDVAYLQYTSGSTGVPKGVVVRHRHVLASSQQAAAAYSLSARDVSVTWLPLYHDMGLVAGLIWPLVTGFRSIHLSPREFAGNPLEWLSLISRHAGTFTSSPNFGYAHCVRRALSPNAVNSISKLELSSLRVARVAGERVESETLGAFASLFARVGFRDSAWCPSYGLAEATLAVTTVRPQATLQVEERTGHVAAVRDVALGRPMRGTRVEIACTDSASGMGPVLISGPQVSGEYWGDHLAGARPPRKFATGDIGRLTADGQLVICGRQKESIIIRGVNLWPEDLEAVIATSHPHLRPGRCAAISSGYRDSTAPEYLVVLAEASRHIPQPDVAGIQRAVRRQLVGQVGVSPKDVIVLRPGTLPLTGSGKLQRREAAGAWFDGRFNHALLTS